MPGRKEKLTIFNFNYPISQILRLVYFPFREGNLAVIVFVKEGSFLSRFPLGVIILVVLSILVYFGVAQRLLDRMRLSDRGALLVLAGLILGSFIDIPLARGNVDVSVNVGGALVPIGLAVYLLTKAGTTKEWLRALIGAVVTAVVIYLLGSVFMTGDPQDRFMSVDPLYMYPIIAGIIAYLLGRSRRSAFIAATLGVLMLDFIHWIWLGMKKIPGTVQIGGGGAFDSIVIAGLVAILLAELIGETRERLQGGPATKDRDPSLLKNLQSIDKKEKKQEEEGNENNENI